MTKKLNCVLLVDDDELTNFLHKIILEETVVTKHIEVAETAKEGLHLLKCPKFAGCENPELVFLDLNMPGMSGWDFIEKYQETRNEHETPSLIYILTTSANPDDKKKAEGIEDIAGFLSKPLTSEMIGEIMQRHFRI